MLVQGKRPRELAWYHAGPMLFGDWGTSRLYVLGLAFFYTRHASIWFMLAMSALLVAVGWAYQVICRLYPDGGGVYSSARHRSQMLAVIGALLLCADYVVTAALSALDAFHYVNVPYPEAWAAGSIAAIGVINFFGPKKAGTLALLAALATVLLTLVIAGAALPSLGHAHTAAAEGAPVQWWMQFTSLILAISGVEAVANMTGIMIKPVDSTARKSIWPVLTEIVILNLLLTLAMQATPLSVLGDGDPAQAYTAHREDMLRVLAEYYVGPLFAAGASLVFALLLLSAVNTAVSDLVSIQYMMARDRELPAGFGGLNRFGMPLLPLLLAALVPLAVVLAVPDVTHLADLYAIGVVGAVAVNLGTCSTNFEVQLKRYERLGMMALAALMVCIWVTIAYEKPGALLFAGSILIVGLVGRWLAHNRQRISAWLLAPELEAAPALVGVPSAQTPAPAYVPQTRLMVATRGNPRLLNFAAEQARLRQAELHVLYVRHVAVPPMGPLTPPDPNDDPEARAMFRQAQEISARYGVPVRTRYAETDNVADTILDLAVTDGVDTLILGASQRGAFWRALKGDVIQQVGQYLPESITLLIHA